jgi:adenine specific DNA methylase Mod
MKTNVLYYGDNLEILRNRDYFPDECVDLIYLDPPFNSNATYNVLFKEPGGQASQAQISAFGDTWHWGMESERALQDIGKSEIAPAAVKEFMSVLPKLVGKRTDMAAYLTMMCARLLELRRVLKDTGSLYLHCDPTASHYLKLLLDAIFGAENFRNEIVWQRSAPKGLSYNRFPSTHDLLLVYSKGSESNWNKIFGEYKEAHLAKFRYVEEGSGRYYMMDNVQNPNPDRPNLTYEWNGVTKVWRWTRDRMQQMEDAGRLAYSKTGVPYYKRYLDEILGATITDTWTDIAPINSQAKERLGYQTQKPEELLERIIKASSNEGDIVLDPFCGCGTAIVVAEKLKRKWAGIDVTHLAIGLMKWRLKNLTPPANFTVVGEPEDLAGAIELAKQDKYQFQWWAVHKIGGQPYGEKKKGADSGIDGYIYYMDEKDKIKKAIVSVKGGGNVNVGMIRDLAHVIEREKTDIGVFVTLEKPTGPMKEEAAKMGFYHSPLGRDYPRLQILTIEEILGGKTPDVPPWIAPITAPGRNKVSRNDAPKLL